MEIAKESNPGPVMESIKTSNPVLSTSDYKIRRIEDPNGNSRLAVIVVYESLGHLD